MTDIEKVKIWVERAREACIDITGSYNDWLMVGFACATLGEEGREVFHGFSSINADYSREECDRKFTNLLSSNVGRVSLGTIGELCKRHGMDITMPRGRKGGGSRSKEEKELAIKEAETFLRSMASFRYNTLLENVEYRKNVNVNADADADGNADWIRMDDRQFDTLCTMILQQGIRINQQTVRTLMDSETFAPDYNPITEYLEGLAPWDGSTDYIGRVFDFFEYETEESREFCMTFLRKWFVGMVALWMGKVDDNQVMPVLVGPQHIGKTFFCRQVLPKVLRPFIHTIYPGDRIDKDEIISLSENCLVCFEEFELVSKLLTNIVKAMVSSSKSEKRRAFGRFAVNRRRLCSFIANCNEERYLTQLEGGRRFLSVKVKGSRNITEHPLPLDEAYAQAYWIATNCDADSYRPTKEESLAISSFNEAFTKPALCDTLLRKYYRRPMDNEPGQYISMADIIYTLNWCKSREVNEMNITKALSKMGIEKKHTRRGSRYHVCVLSQTIEEDADKAEALAEFDARKKAEEEQKKAEEGEQTIPF